ncbi:unnamed protein product [Miscanthus lutarioriparius]|uniref:Uncharacterized protein n=1 Tax=Miscanthus lutarioriparius TaxID=422564 RepID=A0A811S772_9POAL|nr:unnamed protein product [Miscanthus lutarioriparius]
MSAAVAAVPMARKRPAPDQEPFAADANKRPRHSDPRSIDEFELFEVLGEGAKASCAGRDRRTGKKVALKWIRGDGPDGHGPLTAAR